MWVQKKRQPRATKDKGKKGENLIVLRQPPEKPKKYWMTQIMYIQYQKFLETFRYDSWQSHHNDGGSSDFFQTFLFDGIWKSLHFSWEFHL